jgi:hypothetical protein
MAKVTKVTLATVSEGATREFDIDHAERILAIPSSGWTLPKDSQFEYVNGTINRRDKKKGK